MKIGQIHHVACRCKGAWETVKWDMLGEWLRTKRAPEHADWTHAKELEKNV